MKTISAWEDFKTTKPKTFDNGFSALMLVTTTDGYALLAMYNSNDHLWYCPDIDESFGNVSKWWDFPLPADFKFNSSYDEYIKGVIQ